MPDIRTPRLDASDKVLRKHLPDDLGATAKLDPNNASIVLIGDNPVPIPESQPIDGNSNRLQVQRKTTAQWASSSLILREGEPGYDTQTHSLRFGDGVTLWANLPPVDNDASMAKSIESVSSASRAALDKVYRSYIYLEDYYQVTDNDDWSLALGRASLVASAEGRPILLRKMYTYTTRAPTGGLPGNLTIHGMGYQTGFQGPVNNPKTLLTWTNKSNIELKDFSYDGGITPELTAKNYTRGIRFITCSMIRMSGMFIRNHSDWATSFEQSSNIYVENHTHEGGGNGTPGGRDGVHFLDCTDFVLDGAKIHSGDDCVGITSALIGTTRGIIRNVRGKSDMASIVISNEEGEYTKPTYDLIIDGVQALEPARNVVRVQGINGATITERITVSNVHGESRNMFGMQFGRITDLSVSNSTVKGAAHGISIAACNSFTFSGVEATSSSDAYDGFNLYACNYGTLVNCRTRNASYFGVQLNTCTFVTLLECVIIEAGTNYFDSGSGGGVRVANGSDNSVVGGSIVGDRTYSGTSVSGSPRFRITEYTRIKATQPYASRLVGANAMQIPVAAARMKDDGTNFTVQSRFGCSIVKNALGDYTLTNTEPDGVTPKAFGGTFTIFQGTAGMADDTGRRVVLQRSSGSQSIRFFVLNPVTNALAGAEYINVMVFDNP